MIYSKMHPVSCTNTHHDFTNLVKHWMVKNAKIWIFREQNFPIKQKNSEPAPQMAHFENS